MKNVVFILCCIFLVSCHEKTKAEANKNAAKPQNDIQKICFLSVSGDAVIQGEKVQDSLKMQLEIQENKVNGTYDWIPAEKDSRHGKISAKKEGKHIEGTYIFMQEGKKQTQRISIDLYENFAEVITSPGYPEKMTVEIQKTDCW